MTAAPPAGSTALNGKVQNLQAQNFKSTKETTSQAALQQAMTENKGQNDQLDSDDKESKKQVDEEEDEDPNVFYRRLDKKFGKKKVDTVLKESEIDLYEEFLEPSETRFSKTNIFTNYKEFHNRRNFNTINRSKDKKYFKK